MRRDPDPLPDISARFRLEQDEGWRHITDQIPSIEFPAGWKVKIIPPFMGAVCRFLVELPDGRDRSVFLDWFARLGSMERPYWEVYPYRGDVGRCYLDEVDRLLEMISEPDDGEATESSASEGEPHSETTPPQYGERRIRCRTLPF